jgi:hypothetical protein
MQYLSVDVYETTAFPDLRRIRAKIKPPKIRKNFVLPDERERLQ